MIVLVLVVVAWRVHVLIGHTPHTRSTADREPVPVTVGAVPPTQGSAPARVPQTEVHGETVPALGSTAPAPEPNTPAPGSVPSDQSWGVPRPDGWAQGGPEPEPEPEPEPVPAPVPTAVPGPPEPDPEVRKGLSDREIEAAIDGCSPGIRALRRRYGIGHSRAARIHQQITEVAPSTSAPRQSAPTIKTTDSTPTDPEESPKPFTSNRIPESKPESPVNPSSKPLEESQDHAEPESHPCITDRVGPATPAGESDPAAETAVGAFWNGAGGR
jgi:hypothetical protein